MTDMNTCVLKFILISAFVFGCFLLKSRSTNLHRSDSDVINPEDKEELCQPKTRIAFAKTHKTGSSTIQVKLTIDLLSFEIFSEHSLSLWRFPPASLCASKLCLRSWQASASVFELSKPVDSRRGKHTFNMSHRFHRGMVEQYKGRKVVPVLSIISFPLTLHMLNLAWQGFAFSGEFFCICRALSVEQWGGEEGCARSLCFHYPKVS